MHGPIATFTATALADRPRPRTTGARNRLRRRHPVPRTARGRPVAQPWQGAVAAVPLPIAAKGAQGRLRQTALSFASAQSRGAFLPDAFGDHDTAAAICATPPIDAAGDTRGFFAVFGPGDLFRPPRAGRAVEAGCRACCAQSMDLAMRSGGAA